SAGVEMEIREFADHREHFAEPRKTDMAADNDELRKVDHDVFKIGDQSSGVGALQGPRVADLGAERRARIDAGGVDRIIAPVVRAQVPQPGNDPYTIEFSGF